MEFFILSLEIINLHLGWSIILTYQTVVCLLIPIIFRLKVK